MYYYFHRFIFPLFLVILWMVLNESIALIHFLFGSIISLCLWIWIILPSLHSSHINLKSSCQFLRLLLYVFFDIFKSSIALIYSILYRNYSPDFVFLPIKIRNPYGIAILACIITYIPGTIWVGISQNYVLALHVLDSRNKEKLINSIKQRYEKYLMELF